MDDSDIITAVRLGARVPTGHPDYTDARIRLEITDTLRTVFARPIVSSTEGYWKQPYTVDITSGTANYRMPPRAITGSLIRVEARKSTTSDYFDLRQATAQDAASMSADTGEPSRYLAFTDFLTLIPSPTVSGWNLRIWYHLRPSQLVAEQTAGLISAINTSTRVATVNSLPTDRATGSAITSASIVDVVSPTGIHSVHVVSASLSATTATTVTFAAGTDLDRVVVGDYVRGDDETDWPQLPQEFHRTLADATAVVILSSLGMRDKAEVLAAKVQTDLDRMGDLISPRIKDAPRILRLRRGPLFGGTRRRWKEAPSA